MRPESIPVIHGKHQLGRQARNRQNKILIPLRIQSVFDDFGAFGLLLQLHAHVRITVAECVHSREIFGGDDADFELEKAQSVFVAFLLLEFYLRGLCAGASWCACMYVCIHIFNLMEYKCIVSY